MEIIMALQIKNASEGFIIVRSIGGKRVNGFITMMRIQMRKILFIPFLAFPEYLHAIDANGYDVNPENQPGYIYHKPRIQGDLSNFEGEKVVVVYRGVHCLADKFTPAQRRDFLAESHVNKGMFSSAAYELTGLNYNEHDDPDLLEQAQIVASNINDLDLTDPFTVNGRQFTSQRFAFQQLYSNNCSGFYKQLTNPSTEYKPIFDEFEFTKNPLLSFSDRVKHPGKYGFGIKNFGDNQPLLPDYDLQGRPRHPVLGKLYGVVLDEAAIEELKPLNVAKAHYSNHLSLYTHFRNDILSEREISIAGYVPEECVVFEMPLQVPSFHHPKCPDYYAKKYGLSNARYNNYRRLFTSEHTTESARANGATKLINEIIQATRQDNKLQYKNCIDPLVPDLFSKELDRLDSEICKLTLEYTLE